MTPTVPPRGAAGPIDHDDPPGEAPWAMQLVVRVERHAPPSESAACAAAARAVATLLHDERCRPGGPWAPQVERWTRGRIRKVVRRARAHAWEKAHSVPGVTVGEAGAEVRAFVPGPTDDVPLVLSRLQIRGLDLEDPGRRASVDVDAVAPGLVVALAPLEAFTTGKKAAAAGHAAQLALAAMAEPRRGRWADAGFAAVVVQPGPEAWGPIRLGAPVVVVDAGYTEVEPGTVTAVACWA